MDLIQAGRKTASESTSPATCRPGSWRTASRRRNGPEPGAVDEASMRAACRATWPLSARWGRPPVPIDTDGVEIAIAIDAQEVHRRGPAGGHLVAEGLNPSDTATCHGVVESMGEAASG